MELHNDQSKLRCIEVTGKDPLHKYSVKICLLQDFRVNDVCCFVSLWEHDFDTCKCFCK